MKPKSISVVVYAVLLFVFIFSYPSISEAQNEIANFSGTLVITTSEGDITLLESGESIPKINNGSMLEVFDGQMTVSTGSSDQVMVSCLEHVANLSKGASVSISCEESKGSITVILGPASMTDPTGSKTDLIVGETYPISLEALPLAPATAQGEQQGTPVAGNSEVDSTSFDVADNLDTPVSPE